MRSLKLNIRLTIIFCINLTGFLLVHYIFTKNWETGNIQKMTEARDLAQDWFEIIGEEKEKLGIISDAGSRVKNHFMLGDDYTFITTTLGSLDAKEISTNPDFAALMVRLLGEAGMKKGDKAGLLISGSFPALAVSSLAALKVMEMEVVMISSLGASTYGANQEYATWIDMENLLAEKGGLKFRSAIITAGGENDRGEGLPLEGMGIMFHAMEKNNRQLYMPGDLMESIRYKTELLKSENIKILVNIGGNQAALGGCNHAAGIPNGYHTSLNPCDHPNRGIIQDLNAAGIPFISLLNLRDLASRYGIDMAPGLNYAESTRLYSERKTNRIALSASLLAGLFALFVFTNNKKE